MEDTQVRERMVKLAEWCVSNVHSALTLRYLANGSYKYIIERERKIIGVNTHAFKRLDAKCLIPVTEHLLDHYQRYRTLNLGKGEIIDLTQSFDVRVAALTLTRLAHNADFGIKFLEWHGVTLPKFSKWLDAAEFDDETFIGAKGGLDKESRRFALELFSEIFTEELLNGYNTTEREGGDEAISSNA